MNEFNTDLLAKADIILKDLEKEIAGLPNKQVWCCKTTDQIEALIERMEEFIESCYMAMSGTIEKTRDMLNGMIDMAEDEITEAEAIKYSLRGNR